MIAQNELARRRADHVELAVLRVGFEHVLRGARKVDQQAIANRFELPRQGAAGLQQTRVDRLVGIARGDFVSGHAPGHPQHQLRQQQPQEQLPGERNPGLA